MIVRTHFGVLGSLGRLFEKFEGLDCITKEHHRRTVDHVAPKVGLFTVALTKVEETYL